MPTLLHIAPGVLEAILAHAREEAPNECCGLLIGAPGYVAESWRAANLDRSPIRYTLDPRNHFEAIRYSRRLGAHILGAYHSHPNSPPEPSPTDLAEAVYPDFVYVIVSLAETPAFAAYDLRPDGAVRVDVVVDESDAGSGLNE